ncbi:MAG: long-chain-fatty-acid--CoA ligase [Rhodocyclales bacterium]|nr:long-chain-fatty-acid--CoA ligase [Rhodocyclales bacterium]
MEKIWVQSYPAGTSAEIGPLLDSSLADLMAKACQRYGDMTAYLSMGKGMSYAELDRLSLEFAGWLQSIGMGKGSRVALMMPNLLQYPVCLFGALRAGCVVVNVNPLYTPRELEHQMKDSGAETIVVVENFAQTVEKVIAHTNLRHIVVTPMGEMLGGLKGMLVNFVVRRVKKLVPPWHIPGAVNLQHTLSAGRRHGFKQPEIGLDDLAFLQYTGGTTGVAKGAMLSHRNIVSNVTQATAWIVPPVRERQELIVTALPLYHIFALTANCLTFLRVGSTNLLIANPRDIPGFIKELGKHPFTVITGVNTLFNALLNNPEFAKLDFSKLLITLGGGMAVQKPVADKWQAVTGKPLIQAYGLTETSPAATINPLYAAEFSGSIGLPIPSTELSIRDDAGTEVAAGAVGEICIRGPQVTKGYWQRPDESAAAFYPDGYLRTGDVGYVDPKGFVFLVDRKKDMILVSGFNVYPNEVEEVVAAHPGVLEVAAIGIPNAHSGEAVKIFVVRKDPNLTPEEIIAHCRTQLTSYKVPHHVEFRNDLPKTNVGKVLRRALKE